MDSHLSRRLDQRDKAHEYIDKRKLQEETKPGQLDTLLIRFFTLYA